MSFGKDPSHLDNVGQYGASMSQRMGNAQRRPPKTGGGRPYWVDQYQPSKTQQDTIRILPGNYEIQRVDDQGNIYTENCAWFEFVEHYSAITKTGGVCSAGPEGLPRKDQKPCEGCDIFWEDWRERKDVEDRTGTKPKTPNRISRSSKYAFNILDTGYFYKRPQTNKDGTLRVNPKDGTPYTEWVKWEGQHQNAEAAAATEARYGRILQWTPGRDHFGVLNKQADIIGCNCKSCGGQSTIYTWTWNCAGCQQVLIDPQTAGMTPEQLKDATQQHTTCQNCGHVGYPFEVVGCTNCQNPVRTSLFDVNLNITRQVDSNNRSQLLIPSFSAVCEIDPQFHDLLQKLPDLSRKYSPTKYADQAQKYGASAGHQPPPQNQQQQSGPPPGQYGQQQAQTQYQPQQYTNQQQNPLPSGATAAPVDVPPGYNNPGGYGQQ